MDVRAVCPSRLHVVPCHVPSLLSRGMVYELDLQRIDVVEEVGLDGSAKLQFHGQFNGFKVFIYGHIFSKCETGSRHNY